MKALLKEMKVKAYLSTIFGALTLFSTTYYAASASTGLIIAGTERKAPKSFSGNASWYGPGFHGRKTASGEIFDMNKCTAAHLKLPFATRVLVEDPRTGNTVIVIINDRGPFVRTRVMDLAKAAAKKLGTFSRGVAYIDCLVLDNDPGNDSM